MSILRVIYSSVLYLVAPLAMLYLLKRSKKQPEYKDHWDERFGTAHYPALKKGRTRVWIHAVSVGETRAAFPLIEEILRLWPTVDVLLTSMTPTGREVGRSLVKTYGRRIDLCYLPYDTPFAVKKFIKQTQPSICLLMETEVWPNLTYMAEKFNLPVLLVNGRLSEKSLNQASRFSYLLKPAMARLTKVLAQSEADAKRLILAGAKDVVITGNLKFDYVPNLAQIRTARELKKNTTRPVVLLASTREGEEEIFLSLLASQKEKWEKLNPLWLVVPRHPQRFNDVGALIEKYGFSYVKRSVVRHWNEVLSTDQFNMMLGDSMGEMSFYYALADIAIMGGSFEPYGSQSMIEPCAIGVPTIVGPSIFNFATAVEEAENANAILRAKDASEALNKIEELLEKDSLRNQIADNAMIFSEEKRGATEKTIQIIDEILSEQNK